MDKPMHTKDIYEEITQKIIACLEKGTVPWHKSFSTIGLPKNIVSKKEYTGANVWILSIQEFSSNIFGTYKQLEEKGLQVKKGEKSTKVIFWKLFDKEANKEGISEKIQLMRTYSVFNISQCDGYTQEPIESHEHNPIEACESVLKNMPLDMPARIESKNRAFYRKKTDTIHLPLLSDFSTREEYYNTYFHELAHSTGHRDRLNRSTLTESAFFGDSVYSKEELVAELSASYISGVTGILPKTLENSAAYINGWINALKGDEKLLIKASAQAQKATDYILNKKNEETQL